jgi:hypothetical protein
MQGMRARLRVGVATTITKLGFYAFQFMMMVFYAFIYAKDGTVDYQRYISAYYIMWFLVSLLLLALCVKNRKMKKPATAAILSICCFIVVCFASLVRPGYSILDYPTDVYDNERLFKSHVQELTQGMEKGDRVLFVCQNGDGGEWFKYAYYSLPVVLDYSVMGGRAFEPIDGSDPWAEENRNKMLALLNDDDINYLLLANSDDIFVTLFSVYFTDGLQNFSGEPIMYEKQADGLFSPIIYP